MVAPLRAGALPAVLALMLNAFVWGVSWWPLRRLHEAGLHPLWATALVYVVVVVAIVLLWRDALRRLLGTPVLWVLAAAAGCTDVTQPVLLEFCRKTAAYLITTRGLALNDLLRFKFQLAKAVQQKIATYRQQAFAANYQTFLFGTEAQVTTSFADGFAFDNRPYPAAWLYTGALQFKKHFFGSVGELKSSGEEFECAKLLDAAPQVKFWIRNLAQRPDTSFWLQTATDRFYPDFVAMLQDGRLFVIEYKGEPYVTNDDSREKTNVGELWANSSGGKGIFLMAQKQGAAGLGLKDQITRAIG